MDLMKFEKFVKSLKTEVDCVSLLFKDACKHSEATVLSFGNFRLNVLNAYHSVAKKCTITEEMDPKSKEIGPLEETVIVNVIEGPVDHENVVRCKISHVKKTGGTEEGWVTMRAEGEDNLVRFSPNYTVLSETVLTDKFDLKGFKVVRRIKPEEKFLATGVPIYNKDSDMWRIQGITEQKEEVWVTLQGNRGTALLKNE